MANLLISESRAASSGAGSSLGDDKHSSAVAKSPAPFSLEPILLVEDRAELRAMLRKALERAGYTVDEAPDGAAAIQKIRARRYLLVLTDLKLPGASGLDVLRETKQADAAIPVLLLTA